MPEIGWFHVQIGEPERLGSAYFHVRAFDHEEAALKTKILIDDDPHITAGIESVEYDPGLTAHYHRLGYTAFADLRASEGFRIMRIVQDLRLPGKVYTENIIEVLGEEYMPVIHAQKTEQVVSERQVVAV